MINQLECFVVSADTGSFSAAGRRLALTSAAVGKNVTKLEAQLGVRLFQRSTRKLTLTEAGERFLLEVRDGLASIKTAVNSLDCSEQHPSGSLKVSVGTHFGIRYLLPLLEEFLGRYPRIRPDWEFDNRKIDLIGERFDVAIGGGFELPYGVVARELAPSHIVLAASPAYLAAKPPFVEPEDLARGEGIRIRSPQTGRVRNLTLRDSQNRQASISLPERMTFNEPEACCQAAVIGLGVAVASLPNLLPYLESGRLLRVLPNWYAENGSLSLYFPTHKMLPAKTRVFVDFVIEKFREQHLSSRFDARIMFIK
ncbi:LysR family transcriptional regulator [Pantoea sp. VS1]|uniref:LysR family transcriptional regulator n=1 Tax=Pantoea sp. VS1 TaxID=2003658 RepID=UPI000B506696|nr:LysR family transcriptional regulator [Pantoea sp. VS1]OWS75432.1 LysR family transcriptional regulator [Pantoea sp. VS1]